MPRPRAFDESEVLDRAMEVFWRQGYDGASMAELTQAMGINSPSIYVAFGSKRGLFDAALQRYDLRRTDYLNHVLSGGTAREVAERMLYGAVQWLTARDEPPGCFLIQTGLAAGSESDIPAALAERRQRLESALAGRFEEAKRDGDLAERYDSAVLARYLQTIFSGLAVQAAAGKSVAALDEVVALSLAGWPE